MMVGMSVCKYVGVGVGPGRGRAPSRVGGCTPKGQGVLGVESLSATDGGARKSLTWWGLGGFDEGPRAPLL